MTYPVDDLGNVRVDFVWGHMPLQPDQQRVNTGGEGENITTDGNWTVIKETGSSTLAYGWDVINFPTGDGGNSREQTITWDNHEIATTGYANYPQFLPNYAGDGDTGLEEVVPNVVGLTENEAQASLVAAGFIYTGTSSTYVGATVLNNHLIKTQTPAAGTIANIGLAIGMVKYNAPTVPNVVGLTESAANSALVAAHVVKGAVTTANNAAGATAINNGKIKTQVPAAGTTVNTGSSVALVKYAYVAPHPIASVTNEDYLLGANEAWMYLLGRLVKPTVGDFITISGNGGDQFNSNNYEVLSVADDDAENTGGTKVKLHCVTGTLASSVTGYNGTWAIAG